MKAAKSAAAALAIVVATAGLFFCVASVFLPMPGAQLVGIMGIASGMALAAITTS